MADELLVPSSPCCPSYFLIIMTVPLAVLTTSSLDCMHPVRDLHFGLRIQTPRYLPFLLFLKRLMAGELALTTSYSSASALLFVSYLGSRPDAGVTTLWKVFPAV